MATKKKQYPARPPPPSLLEERVAHLEKQNATLAASITELSKLLETAFGQVDANMATLLDNDRKLEAFVRDHRHLPGLL